MADKALCSIPDCGKPYCARGYCSTHYKRIIQKGYKRPPTDPCRIEGCEKFSHGHGLCIKHYKRLLKHGDPLAGADYGMAKTFYDSLLTHDDREKCVIWPFAKNVAGYGQIRRNKKTQLVSRLICVAVHGEPPTSKHEAAHLCGKGHQACVNPHHLAWKTWAENNADKLVHGTHNRGDKHCFAKLTNDQVRQLRAEQPFRTEPYVKIAARLGINESTLRAVIAGKTYKDI